MSDLETLRQCAVAHTLTVAPDIPRALARIGFVQADPIRAPARAQDLILRHRVRDYRAGELETQFASLGLAEEMLHVYGFVRTDALGLLHPRRRARVWSVEESHPHLRRAILAHLKRHGPTHPRVLSEKLGGQSVRSGWGGKSSSTTQMLEVLHREGRLAVVGRDAGIRIYGIAPPRRTALAPRQRAEGLIALIANLYAPIPLASLRQLLPAIRSHLPEGIDLRRLLDRMIAGGRLVQQDIAGLSYVWPAGLAVAPQECVERVCLLAPFDPLVWDRRRFEHFWEWPYRFEAYTPVRQRRFGYYALPLLWRTQIIGWANLQVSDGRLAFELGFVRGKPPRERSFRHCLDEELARMAAFLGVAPA
jgi:uncharacterized protein YcaQ